jgi:hypothetical protein
MVSWVTSAPGVPSTAMSRMPTGIGSPPQFVLAVAASVTLPAVVAWPASTVSGIVAVQLSKSRPALVASTPLTWTL